MLRTILNAAVEWHGRRWHGRRCHGRWVAGHQKHISPGGQRGRLLGRRGGDGHHGIAHGLGQSEAHLTKAADADDAHTAAATGGLPVLEGGVHGDARTKDRACGL